MIRVIGLGDNVVDYYLHTDTVYPGGNALNFAVYANMLGYESAYMGSFGDDENALHVYQTLKKLGISIEHCRFCIGENGCAPVNIVDGDRVFLGSNRGGVTKYHPIALSALDLAYLSRFDLVHTSIFSYIDSQLPKLKESGLRVSYDFSDQFSDELCTAHGKLLCRWIGCNRASRRDHQCDDCEQTNQAEEGTDCTRWIGHQRQCSETQHHCRHSTGERGHRFPAYTAQTICYVSKRHHSADQAYS